MPILHVLAALFSLDGRRIRSLRHVWRYGAEYQAFKQMGGTITHSYPILMDYADQAGVAKGHYFHQDLLVASMIHSANPSRHIDVGSRVDGFVAHVAAYRKIEIIDLRDLAETGHPNISFIQADLMDPENAPADIADSVSCLHAIEHFGLGRYGDPLDPEGHIKGFKNLVRMLRVGGTLYISFPIGRANEVHFNAHRVFHPMDIFNWANIGTHLELLRFDYVDGKGALQRNYDLASGPIDVRFGCGIYTFKKLP